MLALPLPPPAVVLRGPAKVGPGAILTTSDGGQIYGFDVDQNGTDGVLPSAQTVGGNGAVREMLDFLNLGK